MRRQTAGKAATSAATSAAMSISEPSKGMAPSAAWCLPTAPPRALPPRRRPARLAPGVGEMLRAHEQPPVVGPPRLSPPPAFRLPPAPPCAIPGRGGSRRPRLAPGLEAQLDG